MFLKFKCNEHRLPQVFLSLQYKLLGRGSRWISFGEVDICLKLNILSYSSYQVMQLQYELMITMLSLTFLFLLCFGLFKVEVL